MPLQSGVRLGAYEILSALGAGGMGEVYRARDTNLKREVALKVLPEGFAQDPDRLARFQREAELLATLNHPNIAAVYGLEKSEGVTAIVMELVEGQTLAEKLAHVSTLKSQGSGAPKPSALSPQPSRGLALDEALAVARQIADALEAAHEKGVIHRDLKPANIKITPDGKVKVLDFGLAKMLEPTGPGRSGGAGGPGGLSPTFSPTLSVHGTFAGTILGTAAYMSPEQARGKPVDRRTDIWAFGCVLYEMLTGRQAFDTGETVSDAIAAILKSDVDWTALPADVPDQIRLLVKRCLEKDRAARIGEIGTARFLMTETIALQPRAAAAVAPTPPSRGRSMLIGSVGVIGGAALAAGIAWWAIHSTPPVKLQPMRFAIVPPAVLPLAPTNSDRQLAVSPDGMHLAYVAGASSAAGAGGGSQLMVRAIDQIEAVPFRGITTARSPFISPDGKWIAYFDGGTELKKVSITGGPPITLCRTGAPPRGGSWGPDGTIVFATADPTTGLLSVPAGGGEPKVLTKPDTAHGENDHQFPSFLPNGRAVLYTIRPQGGLMDNAQIAVLDLKTGQSKTLIRGGAQAEYIEIPGSGQTGVLVYAVAGSLRAVRFDPMKLEVLSDPVPVIDQVMTVASGAAEYTVSRTGAFVYVPGGAAATGSSGVLRTLVWIDRRGHEESIAAPSRPYNSLRLSPDGTTIAIDARDQENDIWTFNLARKTLTRLTMDPGVDGYPVWTPDGRRIIFESNRTGVFNLYSQAADGTGVVEPLTKSQNPTWPHSISPDGTRMVLHETRQKTGNDLDVLVMDGKSKPEPLVQTPFSEEHGEISPDGRWLAYDSNESGQQQVYVRPFPNVNGGHWQVSPSGGSKPVWARNGKELFYLSGRAMIAVAVQTTTSFSAGNPTKLFEGSYVFGGGAVATARVYDLSRDGQKFLMIKEPATTTDPTATQASMIVVLNWFEELKTRLPAR